MNKSKVIYQESQQIKSMVIFDSQIQTFIKNKNIIKIEPLKKKKELFKKVRSKEVLQLFEQLNVILQSKIPLFEALQIVSKTTKNPILYEMLMSMKNAIKSGKPIYEALLKFEKYLNPIIIGFLKVAHKKGNATAIFESIYTILLLHEENKKRITSQLAYPITIVVVLMVAMVTIFTVVLPKFEDIFFQYQLQLPFYTQLLLWVKTYFVWFLVSSTILLSLLGIIFKYKYHKEKNFALKVDKLIATKIPIFSQVYQNFQWYSLFLCLNVLLKNRYEFNIALENAMLLLKNKYLLDRIRQIYGQIKNGVPIYDAFEKISMFDEVVLSLIHSGEKSSSLSYSVEQIEKYYKYTFKKQIKKFTSLLEPIFLTIIMLVVLWVMLAIFTPIWNMSEMISV